MQYIKLTNINILGGGKIEYMFDAPSTFKKYLKGQDQCLFIKYPQEYDITKVPVAILSVPFVASMLSVSMLLNIGIKVEELDKTFAESLTNIQKAYKKMYPYLRLNFSISTNKIVECQHSTQEKSIFFTGGMDATSALIEVLNDKPLLINIWGGDISSTDNDSFIGLKRYFDRITDILNTRYIFIQSNCREIFNEQKITKKCALKLLPWHNHGWWASIAHILSMSALLAPLAYMGNIGIHYIASSYDAKSKTFDANNEALLAAIRFGSCKLISVDSNLERSEKAKKIINFCNHKNILLQLKVCWYRKASENCSHCEKCYRTILDILANHGNPSKFGFNIKASTYIEIKDFLENNYVNKGYWSPIQERFLQEKDYWENIPEIAWILDFKFNKTKAVVNKIVYVLKKFF